MTTPITPGDLARYVHLVPMGETIPAGTKFMREYKGGGLDTYLIGPVSRARDVIVTSMCWYWTAEPILTPEQARLESDYEAVCKRIHATDAKIRELELKRETDDKEAERLYARLKKEGLR